MLENDDKILLDAQLLFFWKKRQEQLELEDFQKALLELCESLAEIKREMSQIIQ